MSSPECKVAYANGTYVASLGRVRATCTESEAAAARALGRKVLGAEFADVELAGRTGNSVYYRLTAKRETKPVG